MMRMMMAACALLGAAGLAACEKAGEAVDNTLGVERKNDADSIADAVDGDKSTTPN